MNLESTQGITVVRSTSRNAEGGYETSRTRAIPWLMFAFFMPIAAQSADPVTAVEVSRVQLDAATVLRMSAALEKSKAIERMIDPLLRQTEALQSQQARCARMLEEQRMKKRVWIDTAAGLIRDEFETQAEFVARVKRAKQAHEEKHRAALDEWERVTTGAVQWFDQQTEETKSELQKLSVRLADLRTKHDIAVSEQQAPVECTLHWTPPQALTRFDIESLSFPNVRFMPKTIHSPRHAALLYRGFNQGTLVAVCGAIRGIDQSRIRATNVDTARRFKADWEAGRILVQQKVTVRMLTHTPRLKVIEAERLVRVEREKKSFDGEDAVNVIGSLATVLLGGQVTPDMQAHIMYTADPARNRGYTEKTIELSPEQSFVANTFGVECELDRVVLLKNDGARVLPLEGVTLEQPASKSK